MPESRDQIARDAEAEKDPAEQFGAEAEAEAKAEEEADRDKVVVIPE